MNISATTYSGFPVTYTQTGTYSNTSSARTGNPQTEAVPFSPKVNPAAEQTNTAPASDQPQSQQEEKSKNPYINTEKVVNGQELTKEELRVLEQLKQTDSEVRRHEMAHIAAGGRYITSGANFSYQRGPDGRNYAVGGEVGIDTSPVPGDPQATLQKMRQVKSAALAPASPSAQDLKVAANATASMSKALSELMIMQAKEQAETNETQAFGGLKNAADSYEKVNNLPEEDTSSFEIAV